MSNHSVGNGAFAGALLSALLLVTFSVAYAQEAPGNTAQSAPPARAQAPLKKPGRAKRLTVPPQQPRFKCEDGECECKGVLDCKSLLDSGSCKGKDFWQDDKDPSVGGCG